MHWLLVICDCSTLLSVLILYSPYLSSAPYPKIDINIPLKLVQSLVNETSYVPWYTAVSWLRVIGTQLQYSPVFGEFKVQYVCKDLAH